MQHIVDRLIRDFELWVEMANHLPDEAFMAELPLPSNSIGDQFWCLIGARESYIRAIEEGEWQGFTCSLSREDITAREGILQALADSAATFYELASYITWDEPRITLLLDLLEHEVQHMGQLIRFCYALELGFPMAWKHRWSLE
ncbi:hypothetical protein KDL44_12665 [bacterium]|nr:hypothetical protein [bacterium]